MKHPHPIQISIPQPCSENWNKMTPQEQGRFCDICQKCVVDLTNLSDAELYQYLLKNKGQKACGRFKPEQLNRPIQIPHQPHSLLYKWIIVAGLALVITSAPEMKTFARVPFTSEVNDNEQQDKHNEKDDKNKHNTDSITIRGYVVNANDETPLVNTQIVIRKANNFIVGTISDLQGYFALTIKASDTFRTELIANYIGHDEYRVAVAAIKDLPVVTVRMTRWESMILGEFHITEPEIKFEPVKIDSFDGGHTKTIKSDEIEKGAY